MTDPKIDISVALEADEDFPVADLIYDGDHWASATFKDGQLAVAVYDPGASSSPYVARQIVSSPAAEPVLGELSFDRLKRRKVTHLLFLLDQVERTERPMRVAASEGCGLGLEEAVEVVGLFAPPYKVAAAACRAAAGAAAKAGVAAGKTIGESAAKAPGWIATPPQTVPQGRTLPRMAGGAPGLSEILRPGGTLKGGMAEAEELLHKVALGGRDITPPGHPGVLFELPGRGGYVGLRPYSKSGPPTVDVNIPGLPSGRLSSPMDLDVVERDLVIEGLDDWIGLWRFARDTRDETPGATADEIRKRAMRRVRRLVAGGYMRPGTLTTEPPGFSDWELDPEDAIERINREWCELGRDPNIADICWFSNTDEGDRVGRTLKESLG